MNTRQLFISLIILLFLFSACDPKYLQKAYVVNTPNINCFQKDKERNYKVATSLQSISFQTNWALTNKYGISSSLFACGGYPWTYGFEIGGIYFKNIKNKFHFEIQSGYGYFKSKSDIIRTTDNNTFMGLYGRRYQQISNSKYHKFFTQPSFFFATKDISIGLSLKINIPYFIDYYWSTEDKNSDEMGIRTVMTQAEFHNKLGLEFEPVFSLKFRRALFFEVTRSFAVNSYTSDLITTYVNGNGSSIGKYNNPTHADYTFTIGLEYKIEKRKKN